MTEILIVISIIVLLLAIAVPAFNLIRGSRSVDSAQNQVSAMLGRARADAIGLQKPHGIMFFIEPTSDRVNIAEVYATEYPGTGSLTRDVYLDIGIDIDRDTDFVALPPGVLACTMSDGGSPVLRDRYLGFTQFYSGADHPDWTKVGGVVLFDAFGKVVNRTYGYRVKVDGKPTRMWSLITKNSGAVPPAEFLEAGQATYTPLTTAPSTALGFALCDWVAFKSRGGVDDDPLSDGTNYLTSGEPGEETWLDNNSTPLLINRYNGTLIESQ